MSIGVSTCLLGWLLQPKHSNFFCQNGFDPILVIQVPAHRLANTIFKFMRRFPAKLALDLAGVNRIAAIMAEAIFNKSYQPSRLAAKIRLEFVDQITNGFDDAKVCPFVVAANVVGFAGLAAHQDRPKGLGMVAYI